MQMQTTSNETKQALRSRISAMRNSLSPNDRTYMSRKIISAVMEMEQLKAASVIFLYASFRSEVITDELICTLLNSGKKIALPRTVGSAIDFYPVSSMDELVSGQLGIREPAGIDETKIVPSHADVMLLPGVVFDKFGSRIGYGKGCYDRCIGSLSPDERPLLVGLCYSIQLLDYKLPCEATDIPMNYIVTENKLYSII